MHTSIYQKAKSLSSQIALGLPYYRLGVQQTFYLAEFACREFTFVHRAFHSNPNVKGGNAIQEPIWAASLHNSFTFHPFHLSPAKVPIPLTLFPHLT